MSAEEETPRDDGELRAMLAMVKYLTPLSRGACARVLKWAEDRFVMEMVSTLDPDFMTKFADSVRSAAREMGGLTPLDIITAANEFAKNRDETAAADAEKLEGRA